MFIYVWRKQRSRNWGPRNSRGGNPLSEDASLHKSSSSITIPWRPARKPECWGIAPSQAAAPFYLAFSLVSLHAGSGEAAASQTDIWWLCSQDRIPWTLSIAVGEDLFSVYHSYYNIQSPSGDRNPIHRVRLKRITVLSFNLIGTSSLSSKR